MAHEMDTPLAWVMSRDAEIRRVIALNLRKRGMRCAELTAPPGESEPPAAMPQVIILDVEPGGGLDWETARTLRRVAWLQGVPLVVIVAAMLPASQLAALSPVYAVRRPLALDELLTQVRVALAGAASQGAASQGAASRGAAQEGGKGVLRGRNG